MRWAGGHSRSMWRVLSGSSANTHTLLAAPTPCTCPQPGQAHGLAARMCSCTGPAHARAALARSAGHDLACFVSQSSVRLMLFWDLQEMLYTHTSRSRMPCRAHDCS